MSDQFPVSNQMTGQNVPLIGVAGGIASGKSFVTEQLRAWGAAVISADEAAHEVLKLDEVKAEVRARFGPEVFSPDGHIERPKLGQLVFGDTPEAAERRKQLEHITHPRIRMLIHQQLETLAKSPANARVPAIVLDVPLLFESGWSAACDRVIFVDAPLEVRQARAAARGWSAADLERREAAQLPVATKRQRADTVIDNSGTAAETLAQLARFWRTLADGRPAATTAIPPEKPGI